MKKIIVFFKNNCLWVIFVSIILFIILFCGWLTIGAINYNNEYKDWYNSLTSSERVIEDKKREDEYNKKVKKYEVVSVSKYIKNETNKFGGITDTKTCYSFSYIDNKGDIYHVDDFYHAEYGLWKVTIGNENLYIVNNNGETTRTLQLTEETYKNFN